MTEIKIPEEVHDAFRRLGKGPMGTSRQGQAAAQFAAMARLVESIAPRRLLDIGCGFGMIDILIARAAPVEVIHLLDGDGSNDARTGFKDHTQPWFDVALGVAMVRANVREGTEVIGHRVGQYLDIAEVDLVISCRSWGHHYPVSTYLPTVRRCLRPGGHVLLDIRNRTDGMRAMQGAGFVPIEPIPDDSKKCERWIFRAP